jgi:hypothetical protein
MKFARRIIARWLMPHIIIELQSVLEPVAYSASITREMIEEFANKLGYEVVFDLQTGVVTILPIEG